MAVGVSVDKEEILLKILGSLPKAYKMVVTSQKDAIGLDKLTTILLQEELDNVVLKGK